jgi:hypothetical protein
MMSGADNEPPAIGDPGKLGRGQPVAALEDFDKTPPEREWSVRETCSAPNPRFHRLNPGEGNLNFRPPNMQKCRAHWASGMFDALAN